MFGPIWWATPQAHMAQSGSCASAALKARCASAALKAYTCAMPCANRARAAALPCEGARVLAPKPSMTGAFAAVSTCRGAMLQAPISTRIRGDRRRARAASGDGMAVSLADEVPISCHLINAASIYFGGAGACVALKAKLSKSYFRHDNWAYDRDSAHPFDRAMTTTLPQPLSARFSRAALVRNAVAAELRSVLRFVRRPVRKHPVSVNSAGLAWRILIVFAINLAVTFAIALPIQFALQKVIGLRGAVDGSALRFIIAGVIIAPTLEELIYRAGLRSATVTLAVQPILISLFLAQWLVALVLGALYGVLRLADRYRQRGLSPAQRFSLRMARGRAFLSRYPRLIWGYAIAFGLSHLSNFQVDSGARWLALLIVLAVISQAWSGLLLSYLRLRYGLATAIMFHTCFNLTAFRIERDEGVAEV